MEKFVFVCRFTCKKNCWLCGEKIRVDGENKGEQDKKEKIKRMNAHGRIIKDDCCCCCWMHACFHSKSLMMKYVWSPIKNKNVFYGYCHAFEKRLLLPLCIAIFIMKLSAKKWWWLKKLVKVINLLDNLYCNLVHVHNSQTKDKLRYVTDKKKHCVHIAYRER